VATEFRIDYTIVRLDGGAEEEIGFGSSGTWSTPDQAAHIVNSEVQNRMWETAEGMPEPSEVDRG
jgi:hypothetical protein